MQTLVYTVGWPGQLDTVVIGRHTRLSEDRIRELGGMPGERS